MRPPEATPMQSFVDRVSEDGRRLHRESIPMAPISPLKRARVARGNPVQAASTGPSPASNEREPWEAEHYSMDGLEDDGDPGLLPLPRVPDPRCFKPSVSANPLAPCVYIDYDFLAGQVYE
jgi:hypothetical protein